MSRVLVCGDTHCPCMHPGYVEFLQDVWATWKCDTFVHIGDLVDWAAINFHDKQPNYPSAVDEYHMALEQVQTIYHAFPKGSWLIGNHDCRPARLGAAVNIPDFLLKPEQEIWNVPGWQVIPRYGCLEIDGVCYRHGDKGYGGLRSAIRNAQANFQSLVQGHFHSQCGVEWYCNEHYRVFACNTGCGIDFKKWAFEYFRRENVRPILGCSVILEGRHAFAETMQL